MVARLKSLKNPAVCCLYRKGMKMDVMMMNEDAVPLRDFLLCDGMNAFS